MEPLKDFAQMYNWESQKLHTLPNIGSLDLEFLYMGFQNGGTFDEGDIEESSLVRLGVGRTLDHIASLRERKLVSQNKDGSFTITDKARKMLWDNNTPLWLRVLRVLQAKTCSEDDIQRYLKADKDLLYTEMENMRKDHLIMMSPQRTQNRLEKIFEIMPEGTDKLDVEDKKANHARHYTPKGTLDTLSDIEEIVAKSEIPQKGILFEKIENLKKELGV